MLLDREEKTSTLTARISQRPLLLLLLEGAELAPNASNP